MSRTAALALLLVAACAAPQWRDDLLSALSVARASDRDLVVCFTVAAGGDDARRLAGLDDPAVLAALDRGDFLAATCDAAANARLYDKWVGYGEGSGIAVVAAGGELWAARPGPQEPGELAAFLVLCAGLRTGLAAARADAATATAGPPEKLRLGQLLLRLGHLRAAEPLLLDAALEGTVGERHWVARLYARLGQVQTARRWMQHVPRTPASELTRGLLLAREGRQDEAAAVLEAALQTGGLGQDRQQAAWLLARTLHELGRTERALPLLRELAASGTGSTFAAAAAAELARLGRGPAP